MGSKLAFALKKFQEGSKELDGAVKKHAFAADKLVAAASSEVGGMGKLAFAIKKHAFATSKLAFAIGRLTSPNKG